MQFQKLRKDGGTRTIKPGRVFLVESGDQFTYSGNEIKFEIRHLNIPPPEEPKATPAKENINGSELSSLGSLVKTPPPRVKKEPKKEPPKEEKKPIEENKDEVLEAPTQVRPGILKKSPVEKREEPKKEPKKEQKERLSKEDLVDFLNEETLVMPNKALIPKEIKKQKKVGFARRNSDSDKSDQAPKEESKEECKEEPKEVKKGTISCLIF